jgi:hypothetical protein
LSSKLLGRFLQFDLKTGGDGFLVKPQNQGAGRFSPVWPQNRQLWFGD